MPPSTRAALLNAANTIRNEHADKANTAIRVGDELIAFAGSFALMLDATAYGAVASGPTATNDVGFAAVIAQAILTGSQVFLPEGTYPVGVNIANMHAVRWRGPGAIQRGADVFYVDPKPAQTNRLYIAPTGSSSNDGLTAAIPMATPQNAFDALSNYGPMLNGTWRIVCPAGTWAGTVHRHTHTTPSKNPVIIEGPSVGGHPNVPTAIFDGTIGATLDDWAMAALGYGVQLEIHDIKAQNYVGLSDSNGFYAGYGASFFWTNLHASGCSFAAVYLQGCTTVRGGGGIWANTGANSHGAYVNGCTDVTFGLNAVPVRINGSNVGIEWSRGSEGHVDYCEINDCAYGIDVFHNSRVHLLSDNFKRSTVTAVRARSGGFYYDSSSIFNEGTVDANAKKFLNYVTSGETDEDVWLCQGSRRRAYDKNSYNHTGTTNVTAISTLLTGAANSRIKAYWFEDDTKKFIVKVWGKWTSFTTTGLEAVSISLGGTEMGRITLTTAPTAGSDYYYEANIESRGANSQQVKAQLLTDGQTPKVLQANAAVASSADLSVAVNLKLAAAADHAEIYWVELWMVG